MPSISVPIRRASLRWTIPVAVAAIAVGGTTLATRLTANAEANLPARSAAQLLVDLQTARVTAGSGTVVQHADLGLPQLPTVGGSGSSDLTSLISGSHTLRVWYDGPSKARVALMGTLGESDVIRDGRNLWTWSSDGNSAVHRVLPAESGGQKSPSLSELDGMNGAGITPQQVADQALAAIDPTTTITTDGSAQVAGRSAYELVLSPKDSASLIGQVRIAVDSARHVPLRVQVISRNAASPSVDVGFTQISFARPADSEFRFTPPPGAKVSQATPATSRPDAKGVKPDSGMSPVVSGDAWTAVVQAQLPASAAELSKKAAASADAQHAGDAGGASAGQLAGVLRSLPRVSGSWGSGRLLRSNLFSVLLTDDNRVLAGAVSPDRLYQLAGKPMPVAPKAASKPGAAGAAGAAGAKH
jgi:outer membrane lipoprotein-sorting protein